MKLIFAALVAALVIIVGGYAWGFWASTKLHGDWLIARTPDFTRCKAVDIETGRDLGEWRPQIDWDGFARCHPRGGLWAEAWKGGLIP